jgi:hypothetical protein
MRDTVTTLSPDDIITQFKKDGSADAMWADLGGRTVTVMARGILNLAMLWASAWAQGHGDDHVMDEGAVDHAALRLLYETNDPSTEFLPSRTIANIQDVL